MEKYFPTFKDFSYFNDGYMLKYKRKPRNKKWLKVIYYPFVLFGLCLIYILFFYAISVLKSAMRNSSKYSYRSSNEYKKVIKEGVLFDTVEYHER